ncbi:MAG: LysM peptidoglycan-binding domain-containing protein [Chloroflexi bacterium]|nr:LysM peptidoglycan-binding domain-containing protein [Chloroflexota bacterium]
MSNTALAYYKVKSPASILNSPYRHRDGERRLDDAVNRAGSGLSRRSFALRVLASALIIFLAGVAQAQRPAAAKHVVRPGETLGLIAQNYGVDIYTLASANGISNAHLIGAWQQLTIPNSAGQQGSVAAGGETHIVRRGETLDSIAKFYGIALSDLMALNNVFGWIYPGDELALPLPGRVDPPATDPPSTEPAPSSLTGNTHIVRVGETLGTIAAAYGISLYDLQVANNIWSWIIYVGQELTIPGDGIAVFSPDEAAVPVESPAPTEASAPIESSGITHTVRFGDTLAKIASAYGVSLDDLQALNDNWTWIIYVGQELEIPAGGKPPEVAEAPPETAPPVQSQEPSTSIESPAPAPQADTHTVQRGETLFRIAQIYGLDLDALIHANGIVDATKIHSGLVLRVRNLDAYAPPQPAATNSSASAAATQPQTQPAPGRERYVVRRGEILSQIGARFGMSWLAIAEVNGLSNPDALKVGTVLLIPTAEEAAKYGPVLPTYSDPGARVGRGREFVVVLSTQMAYAYEDGVLKRSARISSGLPDTPTVKGDFKIRRKVRRQRMTGQDYDLDNVEWVMYFYAGYAFHGTWWHNNFGRPMSRGCVNMTNADAKWFYEFGSIGTPVHVRA